MPMRVVVGGVRAAAVPEAAVPDEHRTLRHLGRDRVVRLAVVGGVVGEMRAGDDARRAVRLGEVGERPHRVAHRRRVRLRDRDELVVGVDRLRGLAGPDVDRRQTTRSDSPDRARPRRSAARRVHGHLLPDVVEREQVVDAQRVEALERVRRGLAPRRTARAGRASRCSASTRSGSIAFSTIV